MSEYKFFTIKLNFAPALGEVCLLGKVSAFRDKHGSVL